MPIQDGKLRPDRVFKSVDDVCVEMNNAKAQAQTYYTRAETEGRAPTGDELDVVEQHMEYHDWLEKEEMPRMQKFDEMRRAETARLLKHDSRMLVPGRDRVNTPTRALGSRRLQAFTADSWGTREDANKAALDAGHFLRALLGREVSPSKAKESREYCRLDPHLNAVFEQAMDAQTVDDDTKGGYLVPEVVSSTIIDVRNRWGLAAQIARNFPMSSETDLVPKRETGLTVYKPGEEVEITTSEKTWSQVALNARDAYTLTYISHKLMRGAVVNAADQVISEIGHAFAKQQDYEMINGDGTVGTPNWGIDGVINTMGTAGQIPATATSGADWANIASADITALIGALPDRFHDRAVFVSSRSFWAQVIEPLLEARGASKGDIASASQMSYKGYPWRFTEQMATAPADGGMPLLFGSFYDGVLLGEREGVGIAQSSEHRFSYDQIAIRGRIAYDMKCHEPGDDISTAGAIVGMTTAAT